MFLDPFPIGGITVIRLIVSNVRQHVLDRGKTKVLGRFLVKKRPKWGDVMNSRHQAQLAESPQAPEFSITETSQASQRLMKLKREERHLMHDIRELIKHAIRRCLLSTCVALDGIGVDEVHRRQCRVYRTILRTWDIPLCHHDRMDDRRGRSLGDRKGMYMH